MKPIAQQQLPKMPVWRVQIWMKNLLLGEKRMMGRSREAVIQMARDIHGPDVKVVLKMEKP